jgi:hypothetical protein
LSILKVSRSGCRWKGLLMWVHPLLHLHHIQRSMTRKKTATNLREKVGTAGVAST